MLLSGSAKFTKLIHFYVTTEADQKIRQVIYGSGRLKEAMTPLKKE